jgi:hypothetical protein
MESPELKKADPPQNTSTSFKKDITKKLSNLHSIEIHDEENCDFQNVSPTLKHSEIFKNQLNRTLSSLSSKSERPQRSNSAKETRPVKRTHSRSNSFSERKKSESGSRNISRKSSLRKSGNNEDSEEKSDSRSSRLGTLLVYHPC